MKLQRTILACSTAVLCTALAAAPARAQEKITGRVVNGTTHQPVANQLVQLLVPRRGMQQVATATSDAAGRFSLDASGSAGAPVALVQATYKDVNYRMVATPGEAAELTVYENTPTAPALRIPSARILMQADGQRVRVQELFAVGNTSEPPRTYLNPNGTFLFHLGQGAENPQAAVIGEMNMPLPEGTLNGKSPGEFAINYSLHPGITAILIAYEADYSAGQFTLQDRVNYPIAQAELHVVPASLSVDSSIFKSAGVDAANDAQGFTAAGVASGTALQARLSGEPATPTEAGSEGDIQTTPNPLTRLGVPLLACVLLILLWALGVRFAKEWPRYRNHQPSSPVQKELEDKVETLLNSLADLEELLAGGKIAEKTYWKEKLELKARLVAILKKSPPALRESYATRNLPR
jgi:hypothetical protein